MTTVKLKIEPRVFNACISNTVCLALILRAAITGKAVKTSGWEEEAI